MPKLAEIPIAEAFTATAIRCADGIHTEMVRIFKAGTLTGYHAHAYDHTTVVVRGKIEAWGDGESLGEFREMDSLLILAGVKHQFKAIEENTTFVCVHNVSRTGKIDTVGDFSMKDFV